MSDAQNAHLWSAANAVAVYGCGVGGTSASVRSVEEVCGTQSGVANEFGLAWLAKWVQYSTIALESCSGRPSAAAPGR